MRTPEGLSRSHPNAGNKRRGKILKLPAPGTSRGRKGGFHRGGYSRRYRNHRNRFYVHWHPWFGYTWYFSNSWWSPFGQSCYYPSYYFGYHNRHFCFSLGYSRYWRWCPYVSWYYPSSYYDTYSWYPYYTQCLSYPYNRYVYFGSGPGNTYCPTYNYYNDSPEEGGGVVNNYYYYHGDETPGTEEAYGTVAGEAAGRNLPEVPPPAPARVLSGAEYFLRLGDEAFQAGEYEKAREAFKQALDSDSGSPVVYFALAESLLATGDYHHAAFMIREGLKLDPEWVNADLDRKSLYPSLDEFSKVQEKLDQYLTQHPFDPAAHFVQGYAHFFSDSPEKALESFQEAIRIQKEDMGARGFIEALKNSRSEKPRREIVMGEAGEKKSAGNS